MIHQANADFWNEYHALDKGIQARADKQFERLKANPQHPSLCFKKIGERRGKEIWSVRVTLRYRALAIKFDDSYLWFWIGEHNDYEAIIS